MPSFPSDIDYDIILRAASQIDGAQESSDESPMLRAFEVAVEPVSDAASHLTKVECALPIMLLTLVFLFKLFVDRRVTLAHLAITIIELPTSIVFLGASFVLAFAITTDGERQMGMLVLIAFLIMTMFAVFIERRASEGLEKAKPLQAVLVGSLGYVISAPSLFYSVGLLVTGEAGWILN